MNAIAISANTRRRAGNKIWGKEQVPPEFAARARGIAPVIPHKANEKNKPAFFAALSNKARARIEQAVGRLKRFKQVALRCEKTIQNFRSIVSFAAGLCLIKFVHTA
jgi:hypothetical protein